MNTSLDPVRLASGAQAQALDRAALSWGLDALALVEGAARSCVEAWLSSLDEPLPHSPQGICVLAGGGHNAADALSVARILLFRGLVPPSELAVVCHRVPGQGDRPQPLALERAFDALRVQGVSIHVWDGEEGEAARVLRSASLFIDGLTGTGLSSPPVGPVAAMIAFCSSLSTRSDGRSSPKVVAIDRPSGLYDKVPGQSGARAASAASPGVSAPEDPVLAADMTLAIEPVSLCLYTPRNRPLAGRIVPVRAVFPPALLDASTGAFLLDPAPAALSLSALSDAWRPLSPDVYKHRRGLVELFAGGVGTAGAALLASRAAQAAGAGYVRLHVPSALYPALAAQANGIVLYPYGDGDPSLGGGGPSTLLAGPGWPPADGSALDESHRSQLEVLVSLAGASRPLVLDAGALALLDSRRFDFPVLLTPHPGEFRVLSCMAREALEEDSDGPLRSLAADLNAVIVLKGSVTRIAHPDGRLALLDGRECALAAAGSGDVLAGFCAGLLAVSGRAPSADLLFEAACLAVRLHLAAGRELAREAGFFDPAALIPVLARLSGALFLPEGKREGT